MSNMKFPYKDIITSPTFRFLVGPNKKQFILHTAAVEQASKPLAALMNGSMREAHDMVAWLKEDDEETFARFGQYVYTNDYTEAVPYKEPKQEPQDGKGIGDKKVSGEGSWAWGFDHIPEYFPKGSAVLYPDSWAKFAQESIWFGHAGASTQVQSKFGPNDNYQPVFLCHARVYIFADKYAITELRDLALNKLHKILLALTLHQERVVDLVDLLVFSYKNTRDSADEMLRKMVTQYFAHRAEDLVNCPAVRMLLRAESTPMSLSVDLISAMATRLHTLRDHIEDERHKGDPFLRSVNGVSNGWGDF